MEMAARIRPERYGRRVNVKAEIIIDFQAELIAARNRAMLAKGLFRHDQRSGPQLRPEWP